MTGPVRGTQPLSTSLSQGEPGSDGRLLRSDFLTLSGLAGVGCCENQSGDLTSLPGYKSPVEPGPASCFIRLLSHRRLWRPIKKAGNFGNLLFDPLIRISISIGIVYLAVNSSKSAIEGHGRALWGLWVSLGHLEQTRV